MRDLIDCLKWVLDCFLNPKAIPEKHYTLPKRTFSLCLYVLLSWLIGSMMSEMGAWFIALGGMGLAFIALGCWLFHIIVDGDRRWTITYCLFCACGFVWVWYLSGWSDSHGALSNWGTIFFFVGSIALVLIGMAFSNHWLSKWVVLLVVISCIMGTKYKEDIAPIICPDDRPLLSDGKCYSCDDGEVLSVPTRYCNMCGNRRMNQYGCILKKCTASQPFRTEYYGKCVELCPDNKPLQSPAGLCYACDFSGGIRTSAESCAKCGEMRKMNNKDCVLR